MAKERTQAPDETSLREAAVAHLARYAATKAGLARVLMRRVDRWATRARRAQDADTEAIRERQTAAKALIPPIVARLGAVGAVDDAGFAKHRSRSLARGGRSSRAIAARLMEKGVPPEIVKASLPDPAREFGACVAETRRRRIGAFGTAADADGHRRQLARLARAGFPERIAREVLALTREEAERRLQSWRDALDE